VRVGLHDTSEIRYENLIEVVPGIYVDKKLLDYFREYWSDSELSKIFWSLKRPPRRYYVRVNTRLVSREELVRKLREKGFKVHFDEYLPDSIWFEVEGPFKIPSARKVVVVDKYAAESVYVGAHVYAPGIIKAKGVRKGDEVIVLAPTGEPVAYGIAEMDETEIRKVRRGLAVRVLVSRYKAPALRELEEYKLGLIYDQSLAAQWVGHVLDPRPGELIVDMNCAPGGKLTHFAQLCYCKCTVIGFDRSVPKVRETLDNVRRLQLDIAIDVLLHDSRYLDVDFSRLVGKVDKVLIDPPCTSLGVRPKLIEIKTYSDIEIVYRYQVQFLKPAYRLLKKGGILVYSTCTLSPAENEDIVKEALNLGFELEYVDIPYKDIGVTGESWACMVARFYPHIHESPGFFIAKLVKR